MLNPRFVGGDWAGVSVSQASEPDKQAMGSGSVGLLPEVCWAWAGRVSCCLLSLGICWPCHRGAVYAKSAWPQMSKHHIQKLDNVVNPEPALELVYRFQRILLAKASHKTRPYPEMGKQTSLWMGRLAEPPCRWRGCGEEEIAILQTFISSDPGLYCPQRQCSDEWVGSG